MPLQLSEGLMQPTYRGLSSFDAEVRTKEYGKNVRPKQKKKNPFMRLWSIVSEPMLILLIATTIVYYFIGDHLETAILALSIIPIILIEFFQENRTDRAIEVLDTLLQDTCQVFRDGMLVKMPSSELVPGDLVYLAAGDKIPADGTLMRSPGLMVDESVLTGESVPVVKKSCTSCKQFDEASAVSQGTMVVQGDGYMVVLATGGETSYGKLGNLLEKIVDEVTPLQRKIHSLVKKLAILAVFISLFIGAVISQTQGLLRGLLGTLTIAMSIIPEEFPIVFSVFLIMGVWRLTKRQALVRKMVMVETLGSATVICSDKTGTLTEGKMSLEKIYTNGELVDVRTGDLQRAAVLPVIESALLALEQVAVDPIEVEVQRFAEANRLTSHTFFSEFELKNDRAFSAATKTVHHIWLGRDKELYQYTAGAPETIIAMCSFAPEQRKQIVRMYEKLAEQSYRVVGIAKTPVVNAETFLEKELHFVGLLAMSDPPRAGVSEAVATCRAAGIRVVMITGDHARTASAIAKRVGIDTEAGVVEGSELDSLSNEKVQDLVRTRSVFARIRPEQKYLIVEAMQANGELVAMTGDGVNDAPALRKATIGIAMGKKGTEVARAAAGIILLDDNFTTIVQAVEEGRRIYNNLRQAFLFLFSFHIPVVGLAIIPLLLGQGLYFLPIHIIFLELFGDPVTVIGFERDPIEPGAMKSPPRSANEPLINPKLWWQIGWQAAGILGVTLWFYGFGLWYGNIVLGRTMSFLALVLSQMVFIFINRSLQQVVQNKLLAFFAVLTVALVHVAVFIPGAETLFHFTRMSVFEYLAVVGASIFGMVLFNAVAQKNLLKRF